MSVRWIKRLSIPDMTMTWQVVSDEHSASVHEVKPQVVLCHGTFDLVHPGHLEHLRQAKQMGTFLVVTITADAYVSKGPGRPAFTETQRADILSHLDFVDAVGIVYDPSALPAIEYVRPAFYVKGPDYAGRSDGKIAAERAAVEKYGGKIIFTTGPTNSSSKLLNAYLPPYGIDIGSFLSAFRRSFDIVTVLQWLERAHGGQAVTLGERILDEYVFVKPEGKSAKENIVVFRRLSEALYQGGIEAVTAHLAQFCQSVTLQDHALLPIIKRRYVDQAFTQKLFEVVEVDERPTDCLQVPAKFIGDLLVVADFGHGLIQHEDDAERIAKAAPFLALTVQSNGLNWGFNLLTKWSRADYFVCDEAELRLAAHSSDGDLQVLLKNAFVRLGAKLGIVTQGHKGCLAYDGAEFVQCPAMADKVVDRMGAGDAFLGATAGLAWAGAPAPVVALVGNVAAAVKIRMVGNEPIKRSEVERWLKSLLA